MMKRLLIYLFLLTIAQEAAAVVCLPEWKYQRPIAVTNANASVYTNFQVKVIVNTQALISAGKMNINGDDIRFTDASCAKLNYWIDSNINTTSTVIWVKLKTIPSSGSTSINMYYGNLCATAAQNGDSTFILFDDFLGSTLNTTKWTAYKQTTLNGTLSISSGMATFNNTASTDNVIRSVSSFTAPHRIEAKIKLNSGSYPSIAQLNSGTFSGVTLTTGTGTYSNFFHIQTATSSCVSYQTTPNASATARGNGIWSLAWPATNSATATFPGGVQQTLVSTPAISGSLQAAIGLLCSSIGSVSYDWCRLRAYAPVEMSAAVNTEVAQGITYTFSPNPVCPGGKLTVNFTKKGVFFNSGNIFRLQLSDASGNFGSPITLATKTDTTISSMVVDIPALIIPGSGYKLRLTSTNPSYSCFSPSGPLTINPKPTASFNVLNNNQCSKYNKYNFTSTSSISSGSISTYIWNWDDNSKKDTFTTGNSSHTFKVFYPYYYPRLTVVSNLGCRDSVTKIVNIKETPIVRTWFNDTIQCFRGNEYSIISVSMIYSGMITGISWDFGDGSPTISGVDSTGHKYAAAGTYQVRQINTHLSGCLDTNYLAILVNTHPKAKIKTNLTDQCLSGNAYIYESQSSITNGLPLINYWNIGNGISKDQQDSVHHSYTTSGSRNVRLITISDDGVDGCSDTAFQSILVNPMPVAIINNVDVEKCRKYNSFRFNSKSTISSGTTTHNWNFGDLDTINLKDTVKHSYAGDGNYTVKMYSTSNKGCKDSTQTIVTVRPTPSPSFTINNNIQCLKYNNVKAYSTSSINSGTFTELWKLSDGSFFTDVDSISHGFANVGNYKIQLELNSNYNCKDTVSDSVFLLTMPVSDFSINDQDQCLEGNIFTFTDLSTFSAGAITGNKWLFDDGSFDNNKNIVSHSYLADNGYIPGLIVYGSNGCFDTSFQNAKVYPHPGSDFTIGAPGTGQCVNNNNFTFNNNTFIAEGGFTNRWYFGDGSAFVTALSATKKYTKDSTFTVRVVSISDQGCTDTAEKKVTVYPKAKTNFTIGSTPQCILGNKFNYVSSTNIKSGTYTLNWQFGDGNTAGNLNTTNHSYNNVQTYTVRLFSSSNFGCLDTVAKQIKTLPMPNASFTYNYDKKCLKGNDFQFSTNSTVSNGTPMNHNWFYGDNDSTINSIFGQHTYKTDGPFVVRLISSTNIGGCKDTLEKTVNVFPMPVASFTIDNNKQCFKGNQFGFASTSTVSSGTVDFNDWNFGDNTTSAITAPSKAYAKVDSFRVSLIVTTNYGCIDSIAKKVYVFPMPVAAFNIAPPSSCFKKNVFNIVNKSNVIGGVISSYSFQYGNNDSSNLTAPLPYSYPVNGDYIVSLKVITDKGCWDTISKPITVNPNPVLDFTVDPVCLKDSSVFVNLSSIPTGTITSWKWIFGNGKTSIAQAPKFKYKNVGSYDITLIAGTDKGCIDTLKKLGTAVVNPNPKAGFVFQKLRSWENEVDIQYTDTSIGAISWKWNFSSMGTSTDQNPKLFYTDTLTQKTTLIVANSFGCRDTATKILFIAPDVVYYMPNAFTPNDDNINETFKPIGLSYALNYKFIIFDRWGNIMFKTNNPQLGWDGRFENELVPQDLYFYRLEFIGGDELRHTEKGNVSILR